MGMRYVILGGGGYFGLETAAYLAPRAELVVGVGRAPLRPEPFTYLVNGLLNFHYHSYHITQELDLLLELLDDIQPQVIINFAAQGEGAASWKHSWRFFETNSMALARLAEELMKRPWLERFIQVGTSECYGSVSAPVDENAPIRPTSPYAASKVAFDLYLQAVAGMFPMNIVRPSNCYGPGQLLHRIIPRTIVAGLTGRRVPLHGGGTVLKSYLHARDLAYALFSLVHFNAPLGQIYNVGPRQPTSIRQVVELCAEALDMEFEALIEEAPGRPGEDACYWLDSTKIRDEVGWEKTVSWEAGLRGMVDWGRTYLSQLRDWPTNYTLRA